MCLIVGFCGHSGVGKDTCARLLPVVMPGVTFDSVAMAGRVKLVAHSLYGHLGCEHPSHYDANRQARHVKLPLIGKSALELWCEIGDGMRRVYGNTWVDLALNCANASPSDVVCVTDVRYPNEAESIQRAGGFVVKIHNPRTKPLATQADHALDGWSGHYDFELFNDGTETDLENRLHKFSRHLTKRLQLDRKQNCL